MEVISPASGSYHFRYCHGLTLLSVAARRIKGEHCQHRAKSFQLIACSIRQVSRRGQCGYRRRQQNVVKALNLCYLALMSHHSLYGFSLSYIS